MFFLDFRKNGQKMTKRPITFNLVFQLPDSSQLFTSSGLLTLALLFLCVFLFIPVVDVCNIPCRVVCYHFCILHRLGFRFSALSCNLFSLLCCKKFILPQLCVHICHKRRRAHVYSFTLVFIRCDFFSCQFTAHLSFLNWGKELFFPSQTPKTITLRVLLLRETRLARHLPCAHFLVCMHCWNSWCSQTCPGDGILISLGEWTEKGDRANYGSP